MSHSCPNLVSTSFLYNPYIPFLICRNFLFTSNNYKYDYVGSRLKTNKQDLVYSSDIHR